MAEAEKTYKYKASDDNHISQLNQAFKTMVTPTSDVSIISEDKKQLHSNRKFLSIFSPNLRSILDNIPEYISPSIILPDCSSSSINNLLKFMTGNSIKFSNYTDGRAMLQTAAVLGIHIEADSLRFIKSSNVEPVQSDDDKRHVAKQTNVNGDATAESSNNCEKDVGQDDSNDSGINSFLDSSDKEQMMSSTPKPSRPSGEINSSQDSVDTTANNIENNPANDADDSVNNPTNNTEATKDNPAKKTDSNAPLQPHQIKQELITFPDVSPKDLIATQSVHRICQIPTCKKNVPTLSKLRDHYVNHFWDEFVVKYAKFVDDRVCLLCSKLFASRSSTLKHVAIWHSKINEVLTSKNYLPLPLQLQIKDQALENGQNPPPVSLPSEPEKVENVKAETVPQVQPVSVGPTPKKSSLLDRSIDRVRKNVSFEEPPPKAVEKLQSDVETGDKTEPANNKISSNKENEVPEGSATVETAKNAESDSRSEKDESPTILFDNVEPVENAAPVQIKPEPRDHNEEQQVSKTPESTKAPMKPHQIKKELFEFDNDIVPKNIIAEQSVHKICQVCQKSEPVLGKLRDHYVGHFIKEIDEKYGKFVDDKSCTFCIPPKPLNSRSAALRHIATWHSKVNSILTSKNMLPLPLTLNVKDTTDYGLNKPTLNIAQEKPGQAQTAMPMPTIHGAPLNFQCKLCNQSQKSFSALRYHFYQKHFKTDVDTQFGHLTDQQTGLKCLVCKDDKEFKNKQATMNHVALIHSKINEVINGKGLQHLLVANPWVGAKALTENTVQRGVGNLPQGANLEKAPEQQNKAEMLVRPQKSVATPAEESEKSTPAVPPETQSVITPKPVSSPESLPNQSKEIIQQDKEESQLSEEKTPDEMLREEFLKDRFLTKERTKSISEKVKMTETEVWKWFYNARQKKPEDLKAASDSKKETTNKPTAPKAILTPNNSLSSSNNKQNTEFSELKELRLKKEFFISRHLNKERTRKIAAEVKLSEDQVEKWFTERSKAVPPTTAAKPMVKPSATTTQSFTAEKVKKLNYEFNQSQDLSRERSKTLAQQLGLSEKQIIQWFTTKTRSNNYSRGATNEAAPSANKLRHQSTPHPVNKPNATPQNTGNKVRITPLATQNSVNKAAVTPQATANKVNITLPNPANKGAQQNSINRASITPQNNVNKASITPQNTVTKASITPQNTVNKPKMNINQMVRLEKEFNSNQLKTKEMRKNVAEGMNLTEKDVEQWLLKRSMVRKQLAEGAENPLKRSAETEANKEAKRGKTDPSIDKVIKTEKEIKTEKDEQPKKSTYSCECGESFLSDEAFGIHKTYTCKNLS